MSGVRNFSIALIALGLILFFSLQGYQAYSKKKEADEAAKADYKATHPTALVAQQSVAATHTVEALIPTTECWTPCSAYVGWSYKVRTDGDPIRIKYNGADWFNQPAQGNFEAPDGFRPGDAQFVSSKEENPHVHVQVYRRAQVPTP